MIFVLIHGPAASGKLTVARELTALTGLRLFHNHLVVDTALAVYDFGTPGFVALRDALWRSAFAAIARDPALPGIIFTFHPEATVPQAFIDDLLDLFASIGAVIHLVALTCPEAEIERRLDTPSRRDFQKLTDIALYRRLRAEGAFDRPLLPPAHQTLDTAASTPAEVARQIAAALPARICF